jgi:hypothetical protein
MRDRPEALARLDKEHPGTRIGTYDLTLALRNQDKGEKAEEMPSQTLG